MSGVAVQFNLRAKFAFSRVERQIRNLRSKRQQAALLAAGHAPEITRIDWARSLGQPTAFYEDLFRYFHSRLPHELRAHRAYFETDSRGFGEAAFHVMWLLLFEEFRFKTFLEIGVYRGQTLSLAALLQRRLKIQGRIVGISPFSSAGDSMCGYRKDVDYLEDTLDNFRHFALPLPELVVAFSADAHALDVIRSEQWDCVYIDGNHDYDFVRADWENCGPHIQPGGVIVLDDAGLTTNFRPPAFATKGLPGPSRLATSIGHPPFREILQAGHNRVFQRSVEALDVRPRQADGLH